MRKIVIIILSILVAVMLGFMICTVLGVVNGGDISLYVVGRLGSTITGACITLLLAISFIVYMSKNKTNKEDEHE